ncbi:hypothetical protein LAZ40_00960 [Cereibacter sphaeroides]|uniref:hypothetical protein n=1 Tax=Cereibacter sphaeroides TaxID=1063 RepID=UPI001F2143EA|nr:hypothetical protein [Cereibacter sphaeroides]MCE6957640.1 hypothetical protein [Cereibacter sphaeroides]MCE6971224.1 hypothetical protein [Cereibacter sphaeroides]
MILYHGTKRIVDRFSPETVGVGYEANSALGLWLTRCPHLAASYADGGTILVVEVDAPRLAVARDLATTIWGGPDLHPSDREIGWPRFVAARLALMAEGLDGIWCEMPGTDLEGAVCLFRPETARIVSRIPLDHHPDLSILEDPEDDAAILFDRALEDRLAVAAEAEAPEP